MKSAGTTCPPESVLCDFGLGKLDEASADTVSRHLETCTDCQGRVAALPGDSFVGQLRNAGVACSHDAAGETLGAAASNADATLDERDGLGSPFSVPAELANHSDYEVIKELGQGGMGTVYLARNRDMDRLEVLKVVSHALLDRPGMLERFQQEIRAAARLAHPNIVAAYQVLRLGDLLVFAMEFVEGHDLARVVRQRGYLPIANAALYTRQVALGLQHAFEKGMVHRDIKPSNLMLALDGKKHVVKILDFGLARASSEKDPLTGLTASGQMLGTPDYMAPEQIVDARRADIRADIYSLGCTLYYLLSGRPPFKTTSLYATLEAHHSREATPLNLLRPDVPLELAAVASRMMAKDPGRRYQTPAEVAQALAPFVRPGQSHGPATPAPQVEVGQGPLPPPLPVQAEAPSAVLTPLPVPVRAVAIVQPARENALASVEAEARFGNVALRHRRRAKRRRRLRSLAVGLSLVAVLLLAGVVFRFKTTAGEVTVEANVDKPAISVDGDRATVAWDGDQKAEISVKPGAGQVQIEKDGVAASGDEVSPGEEGRQLVKASLEPTPAKPPKDASNALEVLEARWGGGRNWVDVTAEVRAGVRDGRYLTTADLVAVANKDPLRGYMKNLIIRFSIGGLTRTETFGDGQVVYLAAEESPAARNSSLTLLEAKYGGGNTWLDVLDKLKPLVKDNALSVKADGVATLGSRVGGYYPNALFVRYALNGRTAHIAATGGDTLRIDGRAAARPGETVDLLKWIDPKRDAIRGDWASAGGKLITAPTAYSLLEVPFSPPAEYRLTLVASSEQHGQALTIGLVAGGKQGRLMLDGSARSTSCLEMIDGLSFRDRNPTVHKGAVLRDGEPNVIVCEVRAGRITVECNGARIIDWSGDFERLSLEPGYRTRDSSHLFLGSWDTKFEISRLELLPLGEGGELTVGKGGLTGPTDKQVEAVRESCKS